MGCLFKSLYLEKNTHYPISNLFLIVLLYIVEAKNGYKKKGLNTLSLAADLLNAKLLRKFHAMDGSTNDRTDEHMNGQTERRKRHNAGGITKRIIIT